MRSRSSSSAGRLILSSQEAYEKAVQLLSRRSHFVRQLEEKLMLRRYPREQVDACLERLVELGLLDDQRTACEFVEMRLRRSPIGRRRMQLELAKRGAPEVAIEQALEGAFSGSDLETTREVAGRWAHSGRRDPQALARHLDRKGFTSGSIRTVLEEMRGRWAGDLG